MLSLLVLIACAPDYGLEELHLDPGEVEDSGAPLDEEATPGDEGDEDSGPVGEPNGYDDDNESQDVEDEPEPTDIDDLPPEDDCERSSDLIYTLDRDDQVLRTYDPDTGRFETLGEIDCSMWGTPASMAVGRDGFAYVRFSDNEVYEVDLTDLSCWPSDYSDRQTGFDAFGMGFATDDGDTWRDQLYVANDAQLAVLDLDTWRLSPLGDMPSQSELTGNADGELWAFLPLESPPQLVQLDKESGARLQTIRLSGFPNLGDIDTFAFATWGGAFQLFIRTYGMGNSTDVYEVGADGQVERVQERVGFDVVGAGVSTCAPTD